jgi:hypothetical protein
MARSNPLRLHPVRNGEAGDQAGRRPEYLVVLRTVTGLPDKAAWFLATNLPRPGSPHERSYGHPAADITEVVRIHGIRNRIEQGYKQVKDQLGCADCRVRSDIATRRHQPIVNCVFSFCRQIYPPPSAEPRNPDTPESGTAPGERGPDNGHTGAHGLPARSAPNRARLTDPWITPQRWWQAWSNAPPPP